MADPTIDNLLDAGAAPLQYFKMMLDLAKRISPRTWPDWRDDVCRAYDSERGIDLAALRGDAAMLRAQAAAARQAIADQSAARGEVQKGWPDAAGRAAATTLNSQQQRSEPVVSVLESTASAAEGVPDAVVKAVTAKIKQLSEFSQSGFDSLEIAETVGRSFAAVLAPSAAADLLARFEKQLAEDLTRFFAITKEALEAVRAAYAKVPAAAKGADASAFPAPMFGTITGTPSTPGSPSAPSPVTGGGGGGGTPTGSTASPSSGSPSSGSPSSGSPSSGSPVSTPTSSSPTAATPTSTPTSTGGGAPATSSPAATTPASATPSAGAGAGTGSGTSGMPSWLSQLLPKLTEQLGLGKTGDDKTGADKTGADKTGDKIDDKTGDKPGETGAKDTDGAAQGRVTATLSPDGKTVEVTVRKPDGTELKATLRVGDDGKLTCVEATPDRPGTGAEAGKPETGAKPEAGKPEAGAQAGAKPGDGATTTPSGGTGGGGTPNGGTPNNGTPSGATPSTPAPSTTPTPTANAIPDSGSSSPAPAAVAPSPAPSNPKTSGAQERPTGQPCPPAEQGSGADFAVTVP